MKGTESRYEREIYQFLSFYRFFSYAMAVLFIQTGPTLRTALITDLQLDIVLGVVGVYTLLKVFFRLHWRQGGKVTYALLGVDFVFCVLLVIMTNGPNSGFLLYSLNPVITAALLFEQKVTISLGALASLALSVTHIAQGLSGSTFARVMQSQSLTLLVIYTICSLVIANLTYRTNLNIYRRIQQEAILEERRRLRRELHDGVAQSLSYLNMRTWQIAGLVSSQKTGPALSGLRACLRLDPNVILVGEIRDAETAQIATQASLTGHLVLSSVHANDTSGVIFRMMDLGLEPFLLTAALIGIVAQRMVRRVCPYCTRPVPVTADEQHAYEDEMHEKRAEFLVGAGCSLCANTGYLGRTGIFEVMVVSESVRRLVLKGAGADEIRAQAFKEGTMSLKHDGMLKVKMGVTTPYEVLRNVFTTN